MFRSPKFTTYRERMGSNLHTATVTSCRVFFEPSPTKNTNTCCLLLSSGTQSSTSLLFVDALASSPGASCLLMLACFVSGLSFSLLSWSFSVGCPFVNANQSETVITGLHSETTESEVTNMLKEMMNEIGMDFGSVKLVCPAKPITHAFIYFANDNERNKFIRSANILKRELRGRKIRITRSMEAEERF